jgi:hypothetical protein
LLHFYNFELVVFSLVHRFNGRIANNSQPRNRSFIQRSCTVVHEFHQAMASLSSSQHTFPSSDSENYASSQPHNNSSPERISSDETSSSPLILYSPPTFWSILRGAAINLFLPFINGLMLGFGELVAHEAAWRLGWGGTKVSILQRGS